MGWLSSGGHGGGGGLQPWLWVIYIIFPLPLVFTVLLSIPFPKAVRKPIRKVAHRRP
jgi:hypothetical protein